MPYKEVRIFDDSNTPLRVSGIRFELHDVVTHVVLHVDNSHDLNPSLPGAPSSDWGVRLNFVSGNHPLDVYTVDAMYRYPGYTIRNLEGRLNDRIDICLVQIPIAPGGQPTPLQSATATSISTWVRQAPLWKDSEKRAVRTLIFNYVNIISEHEKESELGDLSKVVQNWEEAMSKLDIPLDLLKK